jgi:hypothetical protein
VRRVNTARTAFLQNVLRDGTLGVIVRTLERELQPCE